MIFEIFNCIWFFRKLYSLRSISHLSIFWILTCQWTVAQQRRDDNETANGRRWPPQKAAQVKFTSTFFSAHFKTCRSPTKAFRSAQTWCGEIPGEKLPFAVKMPFLNGQMPKPLLANGPWKCTKAEKGCSIWNCQMTRNQWTDAVRKSLPDVWTESTRKESSYNKN